MKRPRTWALRLVALAAWLLPATTAEEPAAADDATGSDAPACNDQAPLPFLVRGNYVLHRATSPEDRVARRAMHKRAIRFRTERYGYVEGFGEPEWNARAPSAYAERLRFMGLQVTVNRRVAPALRCVEREIQTTCKATYTPVSLSGLRGNNTFYNGEVSNHRYGIAVDVDPEKNFCCGCVGPAARHPACKRKSSLEERMQMPGCWVTAFERFGFYWLGHDELEDLMHFEFLGDPSRIVRRPGAPAPAAIAAPG